MKQYEEVFFELLRAGLWRTPAHVPSDFRDWASVMKIARSQAVTGLVGDVLLTSPDILSTVPAPIQQKLQDIPLNNMAMHTTLNNVLALAVTTLRKHGIEPILLKGQGIAGYYPVPQLRQCGDIDLYVGEAKYDLSHEALKSVVTEIDALDEIYNDRKHFHAKVGAVLIEIHRFADIKEIPKLDALYQKYAADGFSRNLVPVELCGVSVMTPSDDFNTYYIFNHLWHHFLSAGIGLRQLCDLAVFLDTHDVNKTYLEEILTSMKVMKPWQTIGSILVDYLGLSKDKMPFYVPVSRRKQERIIRRILLEGNFGHSSRMGRARGNNYLKEKWLSLVYYVRRHSSIFLVFPRWSLIQLSYTFLIGLKVFFKDIFRLKR